jgi:hypothetical protein
MPGWASWSALSAAKPGEENQMSRAEIFYLAVVLATFAGFSITLAITSARWERHKGDRAKTQA